MIKSVNYCCSRMMPTQQSDTMTNVEVEKSAANAMMALGVENVPQSVSGQGGVEEARRVCLVLAIISRVGGKTVW